MRLWVVLPVLAACVTQTPADTVTMTSGRVVEGTIVQETGTQVTVLLEYGTITLPRSIIARIEKKPTAPAPDAKLTTRIPTAATAVQELGRQVWASELRQIPATVIDRGVMRHVPYQSYRAGEDYELNVYGDPDDPAGIELGVYRGLLDSAVARQNCIGFVAAMLANPEDAAVVKAANTKQDSITRNGLTVEVTPHTAPDAYGGWWVSVYDPKKLDAARATPKELTEITSPKTAPEPSRPTTTPPPRETTTATTPAPTQGRPATTTQRRDDEWLAWTLDDLARARKEREEEEARRQQQTTTATGSSGGGGSVYVRGYYRKDGTYVRGHTRRR